MRLLRFLCGLALCVAIASASHAAPLRQSVGEITSPAPGSTVRGIISVVGSASDPAFWKYEVHVIRGANSSAPDEQWTRLAVQEQQINNGLLASWNTPTFGDGPYTLKLRVVRSDGNFSEFSYRTVTVANTVPPTATLPPPTATLAASPTPPPTATPVATATEEASPTPAPTLTVGPSVTPLPVSTLAPSGSVTPSGSTTPIAISSPGAVVTVPSRASSTPVRVQQPPTATTQAASTPSPQAESSAVAVVATVSGGTPTNGDTAASSDLFDTSRYAQACFTGLGLGALLFLLVGVVVLVRALRQAMT